jgi:hypothetical protein
MDSGLPEILFVLVLFLTFGLPLLAIGLVLWLVWRNSKKKRQEEESKSLPPLA